MTYAPHSFGADDEMRFPADADFFCEVGRLNGVPLYESHAGRRPRAAMVDLRGPLPDPATQASMERWIAERELARCA
jgi:hypothetical protein